MTIPTFRRFLIENSLGDKLDLSASPDLFAFSPSGLGISIDNDFVSSGGSFLVNNRDITPNEITLSLLLGAMETNPYLVYSDLIRLLSSPPYNLIYITPAGEWRRSCVLNELSKTEINSDYSVMMEQIVFKCTTPWFNYVYNDYAVPPTQGGDGKIYSKHTIWKYSDAAFKTAPLSGYAKNDYWNYNPKELYPGKNLLRNRYYDTINASVGSKVQSTIFTFDYGSPPSYNGVYEVQFEVVATGSGSFKLDNGNEVPFTTATRKIALTGKSAGLISGSLILKRNADPVSVKITKLGLAYSTATYSALGLNSEPVYWTSRDKNILGDQTGEPDVIFNTIDGNSDARLKYNMTPSIYPRHEPYIYEAKYDLDYRFKDWYVRADKFAVSEMDLKDGNVIDLSCHVGNSASSEDDISVRALLITSGIQTKMISSGITIAPGDHDLIYIQNIEVPSSVDHIEIQIYKKNKTPVLNMGATYGAKRIFTDDSSNVLLTASKANIKIDSADWSLATDPEKTVESEHYGYIYGYTYDSDVKAANTYLIDNQSLYLRTKVNSPCEITIHGPATNPRWELLVESQVKYTDGFNLTVPAGFKLVVSSLPNEQRAVMVGPDGVSANVYQQQNLAFTNFIRIPSGLTVLIVYGAKGAVELKYREERDVV